MNNTKALKELNNQIFDSYLDYFQNQEDHVCKAIPKQDFVTVIRKANKEIGYDDLLDLPTTKACDYIKEFSYRNEESLTDEGKNLLIENEDLFAAEIIKTIFEIDSKIIEYKKEEKNLYKYSRKLSLTNFFDEAITQETNDFIFEVCTKICDNDLEYTQNYLDYCENNYLDFFVNTLLLDSEVTLYDNYIDCVKDYRYDSERLIRQINKDMGLRNFYLAKEQDAKDFITGYLERFDYVDGRFSYDEEIGCTRLDLAEFVDTIYYNLVEACSLYYNCCLKQMMFDNLNIDEIASKCDIFK